MRSVDIVLANFINSDTIKNMDGTARTVDKRKITAIQDTISDHHARSLRNKRIAAFHNTGRVLFAAT